MQYTVAHGEPVRNNPQTNFQSFLINYNNKNSRQRVAAAAAACVCSKLLRVIDSVPEERTYSDLHLKLISVS